MNYFTEQLISQKRIALVGCSKTKIYRYERKRGGKAFPLETYSGHLWNARIADCDRRKVPWIVLSAKFGTWRMDEELKPTDGFDSNRNPKAYDLQLSQVSKSQKVMWVAGVVSSLANLLDEPWDYKTLDSFSPCQLTIEIHAGRNYSQPLADVLSDLDFKVELPVAGLAIGKQLQYYANRRKSVV